MIMPLFSKERKDPASFTKSSSDSSSLRTTNDAEERDFFSSSPLREELTGIGNDGNRGKKSKHRSRSSTRYAEVEKPKKKLGSTAGSSNSLMSIPQALKLSMLNSGFLSMSTS